MSADRPGPDEGREARARWSLVGITLALTAGVIAYRLTHEIGLSQTGAFFVGLPAILALTVALSPRAKTVTGTTFQAVTFGLLLSGVLVGEGFVCIVMAAPLFYLVAMPIAAFIQRRRDRDEPPGRAYAVVLFPVVLLSLEGVFDATTLPATNRVAATAVVAADPASVDAALGSVPHFDRPLPGFLRQSRSPVPWPPRDPDSTPAPPPDHLRQPHGAGTSGSARDGAERRAGGFHGRGRPHADRRLDDAPAGGGDVGARRAG